VSIALFAQFVRPIAVAIGSVCASVIMRDEKEKRMYCFMSNDQIVGDGRLRVLIDQTGAFDE
jgi:hypothetical protein